MVFQGFLVSHRLPEGFQRGSRRGPQSQFDLVRSTEGHSLSYVMGYYFLAAFRTHSEVSEGDRLTNTDYLRPENSHGEKSLKRAIFDVFCAFLCIMGSFPTSIAAQRAIS